MFFGKLYMGSKFVETDVIYDTMQDSVSVVKMDAQGEWNGSVSKYDFLDDDTEIIQEYITYENDETEYREKQGSLHYNGSYMGGIFVKDNMCLSQVEDALQRDYSSGQLCLSS